MTILENQPDGGLQIPNSESRPVQTLDDFGPTKKCWFVKILLKSPCLLAMPIPSGINIAMENHHFSWVNQL